MTHFVDQLQALAGRATSLEGKLQTEEATKTALVLPFLQALGYDVFDPTIVIPEYITDHGIKKGEKVDYAIANSGIVNMIMECKGYETNLSQVGASQLFRYFSATDVKIGILTNGTEYRFFSDLEKANSMDVNPFFIFDLNDFAVSSARELDRFRCENFSIESILSSANDLKYRGLIEAEILREISTPSEEFVELLARRIYGGRLTTQVRTWFSHLVTEAMNASLRTMVNKRLSSALDATALSEKKEVVEVVDQTDSDEKIITTDEELEGFQIVRAILRSVIDVQRVNIRDQKSYCGILLDDNNRKPICRLHFNAKSRKYLGIFSDKIEQRVEIDKLEDIFSHSDSLIKTVIDYDEAAQSPSLST